MVFQAKRRHLLKALSVIWEVLFSLDIKVYAVLLA
jgi:hypothetical protein